MLQILQLNSNGKLLWKNIAINLGCEKICDINLCVFLFPSSNICEQFCMCIIVRDEWFIWSFSGITSLCFSTKSIKLYYFIGHLNKLWISNKFHRGHFEAVLKLIKFRVQNEDDFDKYDLGQRYCFATSTISSAYYIVFLVFGFFPYR